MREALWSVELMSNQAVGAGIVVFETGRVFGGDSNYIYVGNYSVKDYVVQAQIEVTHYAGPLNSIFGPLLKFHLNLTGSAGHPVMQMQGQVAENRALQITLRLTWRADLP